MQDAEKNPPQRLLPSSDILTSTHRLADRGETGGYPFCSQSYGYLKINTGAAAPWARWG
jgi:hypothetical protein